MQLRFCDITVVAKLPDVPPFPVPRPFTREERLVHETIIVSGYARLERTTYIREERILLKGVLENSVAHTATVLPSYCKMINNKYSILILRSSSYCKKERKKHAFLFSA